MSFSNPPYGPQSPYSPNYNDLAAPFDQYGSFPLVGVAQLPNVTVAFPGEHWSDGLAAADITPGSLIVPTTASAVSFERDDLVTPAYVVAPSGAVDARACIALHTVEIPDLNPGSSFNPALGPNEIVNLPIKQGTFIHRYYTGVFHLTLVTPDATYSPGQYISWDPAATPPASKAALASPYAPGNGAWKRTATAANAFFEVQEWRPYSADGTEGVLTVRTLRAQF